MDIGDPPNVSGWPAYYQAPQYHELWINSDTFSKRASYTFYLIYVGLKIDATNYLVAVVIEFAKQMTNPSNPNDLIDELSKLLLGLDISPTKKTEVKISSLLSGQSNDSYWTTAWNDYINDPTNTTKRDTVKLRLQILLKFFVDTPEHQLA
jgi:hypothetical protein